MEIVKLYTIRFKAKEWRIIYKVLNVNKLHNNEDKNALNAKNKSNSYFYT